MKTEYTAVDVVTGTTVKVQIMADNFDALNRLEENIFKGRHKFMATSLYVSGPASLAPETSLSSLAKRYPEIFAATTVKDFNAIGGESRRAFLQEPAVVAAIFELNVQDRQNFSARSMAPHRYVDWWPHGRQVIGGSKSEFRDASGNPYFTFEQTVPKIERIAQHLRGKQAQEPKAVPYKIPGVEALFYYCPVFNQNQSR